VEIGAEATLFQEKEYINGIFVAVWEDKCKEKTEKMLAKRWDIALETERPRGTVESHG
jgi:hypothetical protein